MTRNGRAFTLLEMMIALAAAAIVAAFAVPGWRNQIARGHRIDAAAALYRAAQFVDARSPSVAALPAGMDQAPPAGRAVYRLTLLPADDAIGAYAIAAAPVESGPMRDDACGTFLLDAAGTRGNRVAGANAGATVVRDCWRDR
ncbi:prepilin-type N-terminal cleavage/methylation domain-containing protein [Paraburkholderia bannensis]|uniref:Type IV pilus assembly protein PilE n=1 Tax=Paraburkholderia tropica TaxID=92647 RepID=A0AAQ1GKT6_9BURK|nr:MULTISPECIES: type IV pilin protein [Paraburkholderia]RQM49727.1 prepilin-type N-terminal cleavage/methylation domain-containing protein [Paraburkholderia bannensis]RQN36796.1 prepilin-type N-terminal cleavage/methylation domain-containing protein [Paraburkholderia tropica]SEK08364.1 type IV pilus assembly protein PilE [Paraburkholderia tropica]